MIDTPISEMGYVGAAVGAAMTGLRPIVEIMFMDFVGVCMDPILNQAAKLRYMTAGALEIPVVFRMQTGAGKAAGAQHSQSLEAWFAHVPGPQGGDAGDRRRRPRPAARLGPRPQPGRLRREPPPLRRRKGDVEADPLPLGKARVARPGERRHRPHLGADAARAASPPPRRATASLEVIDLRSLVPLDMETVIESVRRTGRLLIVHEAVQDFGAGAEIAARVGDELFDELRTPGPPARAPRRSRCRSAPTWRGLCYQPPKPSQPRPRPSKPRDRVVLHVVCLREHAMSDGHLVQPIKIARAYEQLAGLLRERITSGDLREGDRLPSETALAKQAGVSRSTVREALRILEQGGLVERASPRIMVVSDRSDDPGFRELRRELRRHNVTFHHLHEALMTLRPGADPLRRDPRRPQRHAGAARSARGAGAPPRPPRRVEPARRRVPRARWPR